MAEIKYWDGSKIQLGLGNKQANNTGVRDLTISGADGVFTAANGTGLTNTAAGNTSETVGTWTTATPSTSSGASVTSTALAVTTYWSGGGYTDAHKVSNGAGDIEITTCRKATTLTTYTSMQPHEITVWSDAGGNLTTNVADNVYNKSTGKWTAREVESQPVSNSYVAAKVSYVSSVGATTMGANGAFTVVKTTGIVESHTTYMEISSSAATSPSTTTAVSNAVLHDYYNVTIKNAVKSIDLNDATNDSSIYIEVGKSAEINYGVRPDVTGDGAKVYNTGTTLTVASNTVATARIKQGAPGTETGNGVITVTAAGAAGTNTTLTVSSTQATAVKTSPTVTIYIIPASTSIFLNCGDTWTMTGLNGQTVQNNSDSTKVNAVVSGDTLTITALRTAEDGVAEITLSAGTKITVTVAHVTLVLK